MRTERGVRNEKWGRDNPIQLDDGCAANGGLVEKHGNEKRAQTTHHPSPALSEGSRPLPSAFTLRTPRQWRHVGSWRVIPFFFGGQRCPAPATVFQINTTAAGVGTCHETPRIRPSGNSLAPQRYAIPSHASPRAVAHATRSHTEVPTFRCFAQGQAVPEHQPFEGRSRSSYLSSTTRGCQRIGRP